MYLLWFTRAYGIWAWALSAGTTKSFWGRGENGKLWEVQWVWDGAWGQVCGIGESVKTAGQGQGLEGWLSGHAGWEAHLLHLPPFPLQ